MIKKFSIKEDWKHPLVLIFIGAIFFIPLLGGVHLFDWDEINFAEISREMLLTGDFLQIKLNFIPFWEKPPLFFWLQAISMSIFGVNEFAARLPNAVIGIVTLLFLYKTGKQIRNARFGFIWAGAYFGSILSFLYFKSGIIDPLFNLLIFAGLHFFIKAVWKKNGLNFKSLKATQWQYLMLSGFFIGLAMLTKGPAAFIIISLSLGVYWLFERFRFFVTPIQFLVFCLTAILTLGVWFGPELIKNGSWFVAAFIKYQFELFTTPVAGHGGFPGYHFVVLLIGCFPASVFAVRAFFKMPVENETTAQQDYTRWMKILFWVVLILFTIVKSKIVHYSSLAYFPLTYLAAVVIEKMWKGEIKFNGWLKTGLIIIAALFITATFVIPYIGSHVEILKPMIKDSFVLGNLEANVNWTGWEVIPGLLLLVVLITFFWLWKNQKRKWAFTTLFGGTAVFVFAMLIFFVGRIEAYSQRAAISFFESKVGEDYYVYNFAYKSYAQLFYTKKQIPENPKNSDQQWLLNGDIDKDVYFITKVQKAKYLSGKKGIIEIGRKNGFVFFKREAVE